MRRAHGFGLLLLFLLFGCQKEVSFFGNQDNLPALPAPDPIKFIIQGNLLDETGQPAAGVAVERKKSGVAGSTVAPNKVMPVQKKQCSICTSRRVACPDIEINFNTKCAVVALEANCILQWRHQQPDCSFRGYLKHLLQPAF